MDTPAAPMPKSAAEQEILEDLTAIREKLLLLKQDRTQYIRGQDVMQLYELTLEQVRQLNDVRKGEDKQENRVDRVLESCFQLLSLFFLTIGRISDPPTAYALTSTIKRLLDHLVEAGLYTTGDLDSLSNTLAQCAENVHNAGPQHSPYLIELLSNRIARCQKMLDGLRQPLNRFDAESARVHERLVSIYRSLSVACTRSKFNAVTVDKFQEELRGIESLKVNGVFKTADGKVLSGSTLISELLDTCLDWSQTVRKRQGIIPDEFLPTYEYLAGIRNELDKLSITQAWSLRETDLYDFQRQIDKIDESRVDGNFVDAQGRLADVYVKRVLLHLIRRSLACVYSLMVSSEPVSEALLPIYNQLSTLKRCLVEVRDSGGVSTLRELYPYNMKLQSIESMKTDGKFIVCDDLPEGQASVAQLLQECFNIMNELRRDVEAAVAKSEASDIKADESAAKTEEE